MGLRGLLSCWSGAGPGAPRHANPLLRQLPRVPLQGCSWPGAVRRGCCGGREPRGTLESSGLFSITEFVRMLELQHFALCLQPSQEVGRDGAR